MRLLLSALAIMAVILVPVMAGQTGALGQDHISHHAAGGAHGDCADDDRGMPQGHGLCCAMLVGHCSGASALARLQESEAPLAVATIRFELNDESLPGRMPEAELPPPRFPG